MKRLLLAAATLVLTGCEYTEVPREIGYKGKARLDPWLAAERFAGCLGRQVRPVISWTEPQPGDAVWILPASVLGNLSFTNRVERWMEKGGHLILLVEHADQESSDWAEDQPLPILERPFLALLERRKFEFKAPADAKTDTFAGEVRFRKKTFKVEARSMATVAWAGGKPGVFASRALGAGRMTVITDGRIFRNRWISDNDHAALLEALIEASPTRGAVGFMRGAGLSLWALLRDYLGPVMWAFALWIALWLWKNLVRFGPLEAAADPPVMRGYEHHLDALGHFHWRIDRATSLLAPLRQQIIDLGQRTMARAGRRLEDFHSYLADRAGIPLERVTRALGDDPPSDPAALTRTVTDLQRLLHVFHSPSHP